MCRKICYSCGCTTDEDEDMCPECGDVLWDMGIEDDTEDGEI